MLPDAAQPCVAPVHGYGHCVLEGVDPHSFLSSCSIVDSLQHIPIFALLPFININLIDFDRQSLAYGTYKQELLVEDKLEKKRLRNDSVGGSGVLDEDDHNDQDYEAVKTTKVFRFLKRSKFAWFCLKNYYTAPLNKFLWSIVGLPASQSMQFLSVFSFRYHTSYFWVSSHTFYCRNWYRCKRWMISDIGSGLSSVGSSASLLKR
jgi:hypothetical protein